MRRLIFLMEREGAKLSLNFGADVLDPSHVFNTTRRQPDNNGATFSALPL